MPSIDDQLRTRLREGAPRPAGGGDLMERVGARKRRRASVRRAGTVGLVVVVLFGTTGAFIALARAFRGEPIPGTIPTPTQPPPDLGLGFPICDVMSMPITVAGAPGNAYVFSEATDGCPKPGEGHRFVGADLDGNGTVDATAPELTDCFSPVGCETFAAPDVNGDGTSEIAVSVAGADGYGVWLYAVSTSPPAVEPITVVDPQGIGNMQTGPFQFAWVDVVGHSGGARCNTLPNGTTFTIFGVDKLDPNANVQFTDLRVSGTTATVIGASHDKVPIADAPVPGDELCGTRLYGSASAFPNAAEASQLLPGVPFSVCDPKSIPGDFGNLGTEAVVFAREDPATGCSGNHLAQYAGVRSSSSGSVTAYLGPLENSWPYEGTPFWAYASPDIDGDGTDELAVGITSSPDGVEIGFLRATSADSLETVMMDCGPGCDPFPRTTWIGTARSENGDTYPVGAYCGAFQGGGDPSQTGFVMWEASHPDLAMIYASVWQIGSDAILHDVADTTWQLPGKATGYPPDGSRTLCGSPTQLP
jgi:hypothetical protein